ncbi:hypothetical protein FD755_022825, partial [Muntiacus reevesi]
RESVDWRRLSSIDADKVAGAVDVLRLQNITFCKLVLLKLICLEQLTIKYLQRSQEFRTSRLRWSLAEDAQSKTRLTKPAGEIKLLKEDCKRRKKLISTQLQVIEAETSYYQCHFCDKAFMNQAFLQSHIQRCHPEGSHLEYKTRAQTDKLQSEIDKLKEQLPLTKSQLESAQHAHALSYLDRWKEEEKEKLVDEIEKVKEMFMKEFKGLTSKNSKPNRQIKSNIGMLKDAHEFKEHPQYPHDFQNWTVHVQALPQEHKKRASSYDQNGSNVFYKKRIEELGQRFQEQNELIITQRQQIKEFTTKSLNSDSEPKGNLLTWQTFESKPTAPTVTMNALAPQTLDAKSSLTMIHTRKTLKNKPSLTKKITVLEQNLVEKWKSWGDHLNRVLRTVESARHELERQIPNIQLSASQMDTLSTGEIPKAIHLPPKSRQISVPKVKKNITEDHFPRKSSTIETLPFSSQEELNADDLIQVFASPDLLSMLSSKSSKSSFRKNTMVSNQSNMNKAVTIPCKGFPCGTSGKESICQCRRHELDPWASHSSIIAWEIPWTEEPGWLNEFQAGENTEKLNNLPKITQW